MRRAICNSSAACATSSSCIRHRAPSSRPHGARHSARMRRSDVRRAPLAYCDLLALPSFCRPCAWPPRLCGRSGPLSIGRGFDLCCRMWQGRRDGFDGFCGGACTGGAPPRKPGQPRWRWERWRKGAMRLRHGTDRAPPRQLLHWEQRGHTTGFCTGTHCRKSGCGCESSSTGGYRRYLSRESRSEVITYCTSLRASHLA